MKKQSSSSSFNPSSSSSFVLSPITSGSPEGVDITGRFAKDENPSLSAKVFLANKRIAKNPKLLQDSEASLQIEKLRAPEREDQTEFKELFSGALEKISSSRFSEVEMPKRSDLFEESIPDSKISSSRK